MQLYPGLHRIKTTFPPNNLWLYLLQGKEAVVLVDSGCQTTPTQVIYPYLAQIGLSPRALTHLIITHAHADHFGGNAALKAASPQIQLWAHKLEQPFLESTDYLIRFWYQAQFETVHGFGFPDVVGDWMRSFIGPNVPVDVTLQGGERLKLDDDRYIEIIHTPGHMPGHIILWEPAQRCAIMGDALLGRGVPGIDGIIHSPPPYFEIEPYLSAVTSVESLQPELLVSCHHPDYRGEAIAAFLAECRSFVADGNNAVLDTLAAASKPLSLKEIIQGLDARLGPYPDPQLAWLAPAHAHVQYLEQQQAIQVIEPGPPRMWRI